MDLAQWFLLIFLCKVGGLDKDVSKTHLTFKA